MNAITYRMQEMERAKEDTLQSIENISAVSEETAVVSLDVESNAERQKCLVNSLSVTVKGLQENAAKMEEAIKRFRLN